MQDSKALTCRPHAAMAKQRDWRGGSAAVLGRSWPRWRQVHVQDVALLGAIAAGTQREQVEMVEMHVKDAHAGSLPVRAAQNDAFIVKVMNGLGRLQSRTHLTPWSRATLAEGRELACCSRGRERYVLIARKA